MSNLKYTVIYKNFYYRIMEGFVGTVFLEIHELRSHILVLLFLVYTSSLMTGTRVINLHLMAGNASSVLTKIRTV